MWIIEYKLIPLKPVARLLSSKFFDTIEYYQRFSTPSIQNSRTNMRIQETKAFIFQKATLKCMSFIPSKSNNSATLSRGAIQKQFDNNE